MQWGSWDSCSPNCGTNSTQERKRNFFPGRNLPESPASETLQSPPGPSRETRNCTNLPVCPRAARFGDWEEWSPCTQSCYSESSPPPERTRKRRCIEGQGAGAVPCKDLIPMKESETCDIQICEGKGSCHLRFSGFCPLMGGVAPPCPLRKKSFFFHTDFPLRG